MVIRVELRTACGCSRWMSIDVRREVLPPSIRVPLTKPYVRFDLDEPTSAVSYQVREFELMRAGGAPVYIEKL